MVVQKFGGTSVADPEAIRRLIEIVRTARTRDGRGPAVVVSAMSGVTDALLRVAADAGRRARRRRARAASTQLRERHLAAAARPGARQTPTLRRAHHRAVRSARRRRHARSAMLREVSPRTLDVVAAMGELLSSRLVAAALTHAGVPARMGGRAARHRHQRRSHAGDAADATKPTRRCAPPVVPAIEAGRVPVLGGFVGATADGHTTTLGRGGSDYSGALVGAGIGAREIQIWTDVDGMLTADPRVDRRARGWCRACRSPRPPSWPTSAPRCCTRARSFPPSSATSRCASSTRGSPRARARSSPATPAPGRHAGHRRSPASAT